MKILSANCRGLGDINKRKDVFDYLRKKNYSIYCIQDTHFTENKHPIIRSQWGFECYSSFGTANSRGVSILINNNFEYKFLTKKADKNGNFLIINIEVDKRFTLTLVNIYGPNQDNPDFYHKINEYIAEMQGDFILICGDMNLVLDFPSECFNYKNRNNPKAAEALGTLRNAHSLVDPWKVFHPDSKGYTWFCRNPIKKARLDFFLVSESLMSLIDCIRTLPGYRSDHSAVTIEMKMNSFKRGKGFWKFNNSLLYDTVFVNKVKDVTKETTLEYAALVYDFTKINDINEMDLQLTVSEQTFFDTLLMKIRGMSIPYASHKKKIKTDRKMNIEQELLNLQTAYQNKGHDPNIETRICELNEDLENIRKEELKGLITRTKARWIEHGEKPTKYFCGLEKRNYVNKNITQLIDSNDKNITAQSQILDTIKVFYQTLYTNKDDNLEDIDLENLFKNFEVQRLKETDMEMLDSEIQIQELGSAVRNFKNDKSPGPDGFTAEFYKFFWPDLKYFLYRSFLTGTERGELSTSQKMGVISILPKGDKPRQFIKNWRPISLLNISYKILSSCLANRLKRALTYLIHENQSGFIKGRFIGENIRQLYDVMSNLEETDSEGLTSKKRLTLYHGNSLIAC